MATIEQIRRAAFEEMQNSGPADLRAQSSEQLDLSSAVALFHGLKSLNIPTIAEFGGHNNQPVPESLAAQIRGKAYRAGMTVNYEGRPCIITFISLTPPISYEQYSGDLIAFFRRYRVEENKIIPVDSLITSLSLIDASHVNLSADS